jgi:RNA polymerase sigma-70 factor (ECF subfamily)
LSVSRAARSLSGSPEPAALYARIYRAQFAFVWRSLRRLGVAERELADGAQEVFLVVFRKLPELDTESRITTWLYAICLRVASDWRRRAHRRYERLGEDVAEPGSTTTESTESSASVELRALLERALEAMPLDQRAVFIAFELEGMTGDQIAEALAVPLPTVHSRLRLARDKFRTVVSRERARDGKPLPGAKGTS